MVVKTEVSDGGTTTGVAIAGRVDVVKVEDFDNVTWKAWNLKSRSALIQGFVLKCVESEEFRENVRDALLSESVEVKLAREIGNAENVEEVMEIYTRYKKG